MLILLVKTLKLKTKAKLDHGYIVHAAGAGIGFVYLYLYQGMTSEKWRRLLNVICSMDMWWIDSIMQDLSAAIFRLCLSIICLSFFCEPTSNSKLRDLSRMLLLGYSLGSRLCTRHIHYRIIVERDVYTSILIREICTNLTSSWTSTKNEKHIPLLYNFIMFLRL